MGNKRVVPVWVSVILLVLRIAGIVNVASYIVKALPKAGLSVFVVTCFLTIIASLLAIFYCLLGYKKRAAGVLKSYCVAVLVERMASMYLMAEGFANSGFGFAAAVLFFDTLIQCGIWFVLIFAKDLGKKKTFAFMWTLIALAVIFVLASVLYYGAEIALGAMPMIVSYIITFIMFYAKYKDKEARGTK